MKQRASTSPSTERPPISDEPELHSTNGARRLEDLAAETRMAPNRLDMLLTALASVGLVAGACPASLTPALWFLTCMFNSADARVLTPSLISERMVDSGFARVDVRPLIPDPTRLAVASKPVDAR